MEDLEQEGTPEFSKVISKEPSAYNSQHPFRGVAKLGSQHFGFVFDTRQSLTAKEEAAEKKEEAKSDDEGGGSRRTRSAKS